MNQALIASATNGDGITDYFEGAGGESIAIDEQKIKEESRYDGKWVLRTNTDLPAEMVALKYKELWQVEQAFRDIKSILETRPVFHQKDVAIRGHIFCSFLALVLRKELESRLEIAGHAFEWSDIKHDLQALLEITLTEQNKTLAIRTECKGGHAEKSSRRSALRFPRQSAR